ncbi:pyridoxamine 5'-phosphate oxidase family protein [Pelagicoccus sp. SDUM812003]|uniref:pyridoxamine 5'-phosphate oxidase family protein n=1 Tax=Pelagicoccus sp. SDUM812003 TaxID=3041267 RepID=UPI00280D996E|nr:pyridoxamine 5'-phosphate oxidase family protein [Pelagicoccus sp. SDUM812003]MDQ8205509.1 pyridoxamine 5'-phosphate oxidase family protein [Pelagicoccus sp. SDUM812003]
MPKNFALLTFSNTVKQLQEENASRKAYQRAEAVDRYQLGPAEIAFIASRDHFYLSTVGENGWPYLQHRGGPTGFLQVVDDTTLRFADYSGNRQYISAGNLLDNAKACLFLIDYAQQQRLKIWATATTQTLDELPDFAASLKQEERSAKIERVFTLKIQAFDWNCPKHITPRFTLQQIKQTPELMRDILA